VNATASIIPGFNSSIFAPTFNNANNADYGNVGGQEIGFIRNGANLEEPPMGFEAVPGGLVAFENKSHF